MTTSISSKIQAEASRIVEASNQPRSDLGQLLNEFLNRFLVWPYRATPGQAFDSEGTESSAFDSLIYTSSESLTRVPADCLACAIDIYQTLDREKLQASYERLAQAKELKKSPPANTPSSIPYGDTTMGIILSVDSVTPLEKLAEEIEQLNRKHSYHSWVDMIVVLSRGTINYVCQFPDKPLGDWLPPARDGVMLAPMYLHIFARPHAAFSLNRMCALLFPYLQVFSPGTVLPNFREVVEGAPTTGMTIAPYQFNLAGELVPVPTQLRFNQFFVFPLGFRAEDNKGNVLSRVQYLPWQDGGVVRVSGKLPLEAFLVFAGRAATGAQVMRLAETQLSSVLSLSREQFIQMAERTARQSNLIIKPDEPPKWVVTKVADEGTSSPFYARLFAGILRLRDQSLSNPTHRQQFDEAFEGVLTGLETIRAASKAVVETYGSHAERVARGEIAKSVGNSIHVQESIDKELRKQVESVISGGGRVIKDRMQEVLRTLNVDIGFLFKQQGAFTNGIATLKQQNPGLGDYLKETRQKWSERLLTWRSRLEHQGWVLPKVGYRADSGTVRAIEPLIDGQPVTEFVVHMVDRVCCFVEELCAFGLQVHMPTGISITEIPILERKPEFKERFQLALVTGGMPIWSIYYHGSKFEDT